MTALLSDVCVSMRALSHITRDLRDCRTRLKNEHWTRSFGKCTRVASDPAAIAAGLSCDKVSVDKYE
jgi:hypothetical protein